MINSGREWDWMDKKTKMSKEYKTIVDKDDNYVVVTINEVGKDYVLGNCDIPELYSLDSTLGGIDRYYHNTLMVEFKEMGCKFKKIKIT